MPPKLLLERPYPQNLKTVTSCTECNNGWSKDEQYFLILLGQIATSEQLTNKTIESGAIHRALKRALGLERRFVNALQVDDEGRIIIAPELDRVHRIVSKIAHGLYVLRYNRNPGPAGFRVHGVYPYNIAEHRPPAVFAATLTERFDSKAWHVVQPGVFSYLFVRNPSTGPALWCIMDIHATVWGVVAAVSPKRREPSLQPSLL